MNKALLGAIALSCTAGVAVDAAPFKARPAVECTVRGGLPNLFRLAEQGGRELRIGYFGGSITAAGGWRVQSLAWLKSQFPKSTFKEIHGAISGTNSTLGAYRLEQDMLRHKPDLLFVEFAVNDGGATVPTLKAVEGIVRKAWRSNPEMDICFVYTICTWMIPKYEQGELTQAASMMEEVAEHYGIPSVSFGVEVTKRLSAKTLVFQSKLNPEERAAELAKGICHFSGDGVHPFVDTGHKIYTEVLARSMLRMREAVAPAFVKHQLGEPMRKDNLEAARMVPVAGATMKGDWHLMDSKNEQPAKNLAFRMPVMWRGEGPGASLDFSFKGTECMIYGLVGPDCGVVGVSLDGGPLVKSDRISKGYWSDCYILGLLPVGSGLEDKVHTVHIEIMPEPIADKVKYLNMCPKHSTMTAEELAASKYNFQRWYIANILLVGELVK